MLSKIPYSVSTWLMWSSLFMAWSQSKPDFSTGGCVKLQRWWRRRGWKQRDEGARREKTTRQLRKNMRSEG
jgi:hypothetical protein